MGGTRLKGTTLEEKLLLNSVVNENGCRIWQRMKNQLGYGQIIYQKKMFKVHRLAFELWVEPLRDGMSVCHKCDVRACLEPTHLFQDTHQANMEDMVQKGRQANGERQGGSKFCEYDILEIRALYDAGFSQHELGRMYDVSHKAIEHIVKRKTWKHLTEEDI
jgi:hypothetical protein